MVRKQRGIVEKEPKSKEDNPDRRKHRNSKIDKFKDKNERRWNY